MIDTTLFTQYQEAAGRAAAAAAVQEGLGERIRKAVERRVAELVASFNEAETTATTLTNYAVQSVTIGGSGVFVIASYIAFVHKESGAEIEVFDMGKFGSNRRELDNAYLCGLVETCMSSLETYLSQRHELPFTLEVSFMAHDPLSY